jgi:hypothetical protein
MNLYSKLIFMTLAFMICIPWTGWAGANTNNPYCEHDPACWEPIDDGSFGGECCRPKEDGTEVEVAGVAGRCCGGVWYAKDPAKEDSDCWDWDDLNCAYACTDAEAPTITVEATKGVELECVNSKAALPDVGATATDNCDDDVDIFQSPAAGSGSYGVGETVTVTVTATDGCGNSSTADVTVNFICGDREAPTIADDALDVELKCADTKASMPDVGAAVTDNCGEDVAVWQSPEAGSGQYGDGETATVTVTATDGCGNTASETVTVRFAYNCDIDALVAARNEVIRLHVLYRDGCQLAGEIVDRMRQTYAEIKDIGEGYDPPLWSPEPGALLGIELLKLIGKLIGELELLCNQLKELCSEMDSLEAEIYEAYINYAKIYWDLECWNRCHNPMPTPGPISCPPCEKSSTCHIFDINF